MCNVHSFTLHTDNVLVRSLCARGGRRRTQKHRRDVPVVPVVGDDGNGLAIVSGQHTNYRWASFGLKRDAIADSELKHLRVRLHLVEETKAFHDPVVQIDQFRFGQPIDVNSHSFILRRHDVCESLLGLTPNATI